LEALTFREVARLINRAGSIRIQDSPTKEERGQWALYEAVIQTGSIQLGVRIIYVYSDASIEGTRSARTLIKSQANPTLQFQVVLASSLRKDPSLFNKFKESTNNCLYLEEFFSSFIRNQLDNYLKKVSALVFNNYVDPQIEVAETFKVGASGVNPVLRFLLSPRMSSELFAREIGVLFAEPGQGKTFMTRYLASEISKKKKIPLYVHSEQWSRMQTDEISSLYKTLIHSFKYFESPIGWTDGAEEDFVKVALKAGLFVVIFDGFDEYVLSNHGDVDAIETITALQDVAEETGAPILLTTRTSFWESEINQNPRNKDISLPVKFEIRPFDEGKARSYFTQRLKNKIDQDVAGELFMELKKRIAGGIDFVGRGFFLFLIADLVERGFSLKSINLTNKTSLQWVMEELCERERTRQKVVLSAGEQIAAFREFAACVLEGLTSNTETLRLAIQGVATLSEAEIEASLSSTGKLKDHPLIRRGIRDTWDFTQEQVRVTLLAQRLLELADPQHTKIDPLRHFLVASGSDSNLQAEIATSVVNHLVETLGAQRAQLRLKEIVRTVFQVSNPGIHTAKVDGVSSFGTMLALMVVNKLLPSGSQHKERTQTLVNLLPNGLFESLSFSGTVARFDFSGIHFQNCTFNNLNWANCKFDSSTKYSSCRFQGGMALSCGGYGLATWATDCTYDDDARALIDTETVRAGKRRYGTEDLRSDVQLILRKFVPKESLGTKSISEKYLLSGQISSSVHAKEIAAAFKKTILDPHEISGAESKGLHVKEEARDAVIYWAANGVFTGALATLFDDLIAALSVAKE
jgi:NACHT domain